MRSFQQSRQQFRGHAASDEMAHIATLGNRSIHCRTFVGAESQIIHGLKSAATA
jgi:hypothetical protein